MQESPAEGDGDRVGAIVGAKFVYDVLDVEVDGGLGDGQAGGDFLVPIAIADQPQDLNFAGRKVIFAHEFSEPGGYLRGNVAPTAMNGANDGQELIFGRAFQYVGKGPSTERTLNLYVSVRGGEDDDS